MDLNAFQRAGIDAVLTPEAQEIRPGVAVTGQVPRLTTFEVTGSALTEKMKAGEWIADEILDEQATVFSLKDKGLVVLTGCSHCGVINAVRHAQKITGVHRVYAVLGGFHLSGKRAEPAVEPTVAALEELKPEYVVPSHCSGFNAASLISSRMPDAFIPNSVGTRFQFA
jgi:7,8-dihydropterin-6-yl-methyl-4-(beta-D-ribofuranosyl)aminobenzene 5'-phosphate synthase